MGLGHDRLQWGFSVGHAEFIFLTDCAPVHIVFSEFFHSSALIGLAEEMGHVRDSGVSYKWMLMVQVENFTSLFEVFRELNLGEVCG